jgi:hypothetical protein
MSTRNFISRVPDDRLVKLPVYAQDEINMARRYIAELEAELTALVDPDHSVTTHADPYGDRPKPIGNNPTVCHRLETGDEFTVEMGPHGLKIMATSAGYWTYPAVLPEVSNVLHVKMVDSRTLPGGGK